MLKALRGGWDGDVSQIRLLTCVFLALFAAEIACARPPDILNVELKPETLEAFARYVQATEARIQSDSARPDAFLYIDGLSAERRTEVFAQLKRGGIFTERLETRDPATREEISVPDGLVHHWLGAVFIPGATLAQTLDLLEDYDHYANLYKPEVVRSKLISREGNDFKIYLRLRKKKVITLTFNTEHEVHYQLVGAQRAFSRSHTARIAEVENADQPDEREKAVGRDGGFFWRFNTYGRFEERDGGVYFESESVTLTRGIPLGLAWLIKPFVTSIPKESLTHTLGATRSELLARIDTARKK